MKASEVIPGILDLYKYAQDLNIRVIPFSPKFSEKHGIYSGDFRPLAYLLAKETGRPFLFNFQRVPRITVRSFHIPESISLTSNSLELFVLLNKLLQKKYNIASSFEPMSSSPLLFKISISPTLVRNTENIANLITFLGKIFQHRIKIKEDKKLYCKFCGLRSSFIDVPICVACLSKIRKDNLIKYGETLDPEYLFKSKRNQLRRGPHHTARILLGLKRMPRRKRRYKRCIECDQPLSPITCMFNENICLMCESKFNFEFFQVEYENGRVTWKDFEKDPKVRERYKYSYFE